MSDCQSWFGSARSNRRGAGSSRGVLAGASILPASCSIRRTSVSLTGSASNRFSTSRMRRVPYSGCAAFSASTASRRGSSSFPPRGAGPFFFGNRASYPPFA
jgi:hypothetical protein